ncbi:polyamine ABC transporter substrate-binding protein [Vogesella sp. LIG4]|uniref:polyamine ABC transporter substrate-binding protein n=1 Tax=Vogesella sp. LIG4 TaxID=1192162 RepID=UPI00081FA0C5|nr:polyamine ABC transporter substrate-binding protein [Vogesella sp. LIG4]SCK25616.1 putrescine transport system substrate-binding protein [Vogesella sp. LIG4]
MYKHRAAKLALGMALAAASLTTLAAAKPAAGLNVFNWGDFIARDTVANFEKLFGTHAEYDTYDSDDVLQAKLLVGHTGYDIVVPSSGSLAKQIEIGLYQKLDKRKIPNLANLDPTLMKMLSAADPGGQYGVPWAYAATGIGYNVAAAKKAFGDKVPDGWSLVFDPAQLGKLKGCGVSFLDSPGSMFPAVLQYLHKDPNSTNPADYQAALAVLQKVRPYVRQFNSSSYINDLANNDVCVAVGWSGDVGIAGRRAREAGRPYDIRYLNPKEGGFMWFDVMVIPRDAPHADMAHKWINYILDPKVSASITSEVYYPTANRLARQHLPVSIINDPTVFPPQAELLKMAVMKQVPPEIQRLQSRLWQKLKSGN